MKKAFTLVLALIIIFSLCACDDSKISNNDNPQIQGTDNQQVQNNDTPSNKKYKLTVIDYWGYLVKPLEEYYEAGEEVDVTLAFLSGPSVGIELNGEYIGESVDTKHDGVYPVITFSMPAKDSVLYTTQNGRIYKDNNQQSQDNNENQTKNYELPKPTTNLEFWISENVDNIDFSKYQEKYGMFGGHKYYGIGYLPTFDEYNQPIDPDHYVIYTVTSYPDYSDKEQHITNIYITDPNIKFYGINLTSSFEDFERLMIEQGFIIAGSNENHHTAEKGKFSITITKKWIRIHVEVENKDGIIF